MKHCVADASAEPLLQDGCEFAPPVALPETWGVSWERQLAAIAAWQQAHAQPFPERRREARTIHFPDRRKAA